MGLFTRSIRPPDDIVPNSNDPAAVPPSTVGPDQLVTPGDPNGLVVEGPDGPGWLPPRIIPSAWSGWPADWWPPYWGGGSSLSRLTDIAWTCVDLNASVLSTMPPYLVKAPPSLDAAWLTNPDPDVYYGWEEFLKQMAWDFQLGEAFVLATARYSSGWPARFHVVPPWSVEVEVRDGMREYRIGDVDVTPDILHVRYQSQVGDGRGHGPLEAGQGRLVAAEMLRRYAYTLFSSGGIPSGVLNHPVTQTPEQAAKLKQDWMTARLSGIGEPAVLSGGLTWTPTQLDPEKLALSDQSRLNDSAIAVMLGVPPELVGLPSGHDSLTYKNTESIFDYHWRASLRPKAQHMMAALSGWALPRGVRVELNRDEYIQPGPYERAQTAQILNAIVDPATGQPALSVAEIRDAERLDQSSPQPVSEGVLR